MAIRLVAGKTIAVLTKDAADVILFRAMLNVRKVEEEKPVVKIRLDNGWSFQVAPRQILFSAALQPLAADELKPGATLRPAFSYPPGYRYRTDAGKELVSEAALHVVEVSAGGDADIYSLDVNQTGCFFLSAGVLCKAE